MLKRNFSRFIKIAKEYNYFTAIKLYVYYTFFRQNKYIDYLEEILTKEFLETIKYYRQMPKTNKMQKTNKTIWIFWWQGLANMPEIPKTCYASLKRNIPKEYNIVVLDKQNFQKYVKIPSYILGKVENGSITLTHFSDLLRQALLCKKGGVWVDATVFCPNNISNKKLPNTDFWSIKIRRSKLSKQSYGQKISEGKYSGFFLLSNPRSVLMNFVKDCNFKYWQQHDALIEYFIQILLMRIAYKNIPDAKKEIDSYDYSNNNLYDLDKIMDNEFNEEIYKKLTKDTSFFKLSWKKEYKKLTADGKKTFYGYIYDEYANKKEFV